MKFIITESQYKLLIEQAKWYEKPGFEQYAPTEYEKRELKKSETYLNDMDKHTWMTIMQIGTSFIPFVGPFVSAGIGAADAKLYLDDGDEKTAGMILLFSAIPGIGGLASKLGLGKWTSKALGVIGKKIGLGQKLTPVESEVTRRIAKYKQLIQDEFTKLGKNATMNTAKEGAKKKIVQQNVLKNTGKFAGTVAGYGAVGAGYSQSYDYVQRTTPEVKASKEGYNWAFVKDAFGSSGTEEENKLLNRAWDAGWRPGQVVPEKFQLNKYKQDYAQEDANAKKLEQLVASLKK